MHTNTLFFHFNVTTHHQIYMDNRKALKGHQRRPSMMDRVKRVFSQPHAMDSHGSAKTAPTPSLLNTMPGSFVEKSTPSTSPAPSNPPLDPTPTPTKLLADFFAKKGNLQLSPVEYAGVLALMAKAAPQQDLTNGKMAESTNDVTRDDTGNNLPRFPARDIAATANSTTLSRAPRRPSATTHRSFRMASANTSLASNLDYTPAYHTFSGHSAVPVRRVHRFAGLPLPYRTRIRAPSLGSGAPSPHRSMLSNTSISLIKPGHHVSQTASALRTILDSNLLAHPSPDRFANPYAHTRKRRHPTHPAKEIELLLVFDKSVPINKDTDLPPHKKANNLAKHPSTVGPPPAPKPASIRTEEGPSSVPPPPTTMAFPAISSSPATKDPVSTPATPSATSCSAQPQRYLFPFPQPILQSVMVDRNKVEQYKSLFLF